MPVPQQGSSPIRLSTGHGVHTGVSRWRRAGVPWRRAPGRRVPLQPPCTPSQAPPALGTGVAAGSGGKQGPASTRALSFEPALALPKARSDLQGQVKSRERSFGTAGLPQAPR